MILSRLKRLEKKKKQIVEKNMQIKMNVNPLSVNKCWKGKRFKTPTYKAYEKLLLYTLPTRELPKSPYMITFEFGFSSKLSDWDNPIKPLQDVLAKKYGFNDRDVFKSVTEKKIVEKGEEYFKIEIKELL